MDSDLQDDDDDEEESDDLCCQIVSWPHHHLCSEHGWCLLWMPLLAFLIWYIYLVYVLTSANDLAPPFAFGHFLVGSVMACCMPSPGRNVWFLCLPCVWFSMAFPGSYSWFWAAFAPMPSQTSRRVCMPNEFFGIVQSTFPMLPFPRSSPYLRGECADPVCGFVFRVADDARLHGRRRPVFASGNVDISNAEQLPEPCRIVMGDGTVPAADAAECFHHCSKWLDAGLRWRFVGHYLAPFCSVVAGWGTFGGGSVYAACGKSAVVLSHLGHPAVMFSIAALYALPMLVVLAKEVRGVWRSQPASAEESTPVIERTWDPSPVACLPDGRFPKGAMYFPYCCLSVSSDARGERLSFLLESLWVVPDVPMDILACLVYLRMGRAHRAFAVLAVLLLACDPFQLEGARALTSRWQSGFPSRQWWQYRGTQGSCESGLTAALAIYSLASTLPETSPQARLHSMTLAFSASTSLLAVSAGAEAHALLHLADHAALELRDYYAVMRTRKRLGRVRLAAMLRVLSSAWAAVLADAAGKPELVALNIAAVLLEAMAREWDSHRRTMRLSLVAQAFRYFCLLLTLLAGVGAAVSSWDDLYRGFEQFCGWQSFLAVGASLSKVGYIVLVGPLAFVLTPFADMMAHRAFHAVRAVLRGCADPAAAESRARSSSVSGSSAEDPSFDESVLNEDGAAFEDVEDTAGAFVQPSIEPNFFA